jgi:predicted CopG family antitoxin
LSTVATISATSLSSAAERRKRLRLKRIVVSEYNYLALKRLGQAVDSFNDVISKLLRIERSYHEMKKRQQRPQENRNNNDGLSFLGNPSVVI